MTIERKPSISSEELKPTLPHPLEKEIKQTNVLPHPPGLQGELKLRQKQIRKTLNIEPKTSEKIQKIIESDGNVKSAKEKLDVLKNAQKYGISLEKAQKNKLAQEFIQNKNFTLVKDKLTEQIVFLPKENIKKQKNFIELTGWEYTLVKKSHTSAEIKRKRRLFETKFGSEKEIPEVEKEIKEPETIRFYKQKIDEIIEKYADAIEKARLEQKTKYADALQTKVDDLTFARRKLETEKKLDKKILPLIV